MRKTQSSIDCHSFFFFAGVIKCRNTCNPLVNSVLHMLKAVLSWCVHVGLSCQSGGGEKPWSAVMPCVMSEGGQRRITSLWECVGKAGAEQAGLVLITVNNPVCKTPSFSHTLFFCFFSHTYQCLIRTPSSWGVACSCSRW